MSSGKFSLCGAASGVEHDQLVNESPVNLRGSTALDVRWLDATVWHTIDEGHDATRPARPWKNVLPQLWISTSFGEAVFYVSWICNNLPGISRHRITALHDDEIPRGVKNLLWGGSGQPYLVNVKNMGGSPADVGEVPVT